MTNILFSNPINLQHATLFYNHQEESKTIFLKKEKNNFLVVHSLCEGERGREKLLAHNAAVFGVLKKDDSTATCSPACV